MCLKSPTGSHIDTGNTSWIRRTTNNLSLKGWNTDRSGYGSWLAIFSIVITPIIDQHNITTVISLGQSSATDNYPYYSSLAAKADITTKHSYRNVDARRRRPIHMDGIHTFGAFPSFTWINIWIWRYYPVSAFLVGWCLLNAFVELYIPHLVHLLPCWKTTTWSPDILSSLRIPIRVLYASNHWKERSAYDYHATTLSAAYAWVIFGSRVSSKATLEECDAQIQSVSR